MESIGNDIVDLRVVEPPLHPRYRERVFTVREREYIGDNQRVLWQVWAAKEAAYKALRRLSENVFFAPAHFEYVPDQSCVCFHDNRIFIEIVQCGEFLFVVGATKRALVGEVLKNTWVGVCRKEENPSLQVRNLLLSALNLGIQGGVYRMSDVQQARRVSGHRLSPIVRELRVSRPCDGRIPFLTLTGVRSQDLISFSHHGRFVLASHCMQGANRKKLDRYDENHTFFGNP